MRTLLSYVEEARLTSIYILENYLNNLGTDADECFVLELQKIISRLKQEKTK